MQAEKSWDNTRLEVIGELAPVTWINHIMRKYEDVSLFSQTTVPPSHQADNTRL